MDVCVYGAASPQIAPKYIVEGEALGREMAKRNMRLVFGGGKNGLMGAVARGVKSGGGKITGVAPKNFKVDGVLFESCDEFLRPETMMERKRLLRDLSSAYIVTPGGIGTLDEFFEVFTLNHLNMENKPIIILNTDGFYDGLIAFLDFLVQQKALSERSRDRIFVTGSIKEALDFAESKANG